MPANSLGSPLKLDPEFDHFFAISTANTLLQVIITTAWMIATVSLKGYPYLPSLPLEYGRRDPLNMQVESCRSFV